MPHAPRLWPAVPCSSQRERAVGQGIRAVAAHELAREQRADRAVGVPHLAVGS